MLSNHLILWSPFLLCRQSFPASGCFPVSWLSHQVANTKLELSFRIDWFEILVVQANLKSLLQHHNSKALILWHSPFFMVQISCLYMITGKTIALTIWTYDSKVMFLLFNTLSRFVISFLPRGKGLLISWLQSLSAVILEPKKRKSVTASSFSPSICYKVMGPDAMILAFLMLNFKPGFSFFSFTGRN